MKCTIEGKVLPLAGVSGHLYLEIFDERGKRLCQINGLATDAQSGKVKSVGATHDLIKAYVSADDGILLGVSHRSTRQRHRHAGKVLFEGSREEIEHALSALRKRAAEINAENAPYKIFSLNSNTVFREMVLALDAVLTLDKDALRELMEMKSAFPGIATNFNHAIAKLKSAPPPSRKPRPPSA